MTQQGATQASTQAGSWKGHGKSYDRFSIQENHPNGFGYLGAQQGFAGCGRSNQAAAEKRRRVNSNKQKQRRAINHPLLYFSQA